MLTILFFNFVMSVFHQKLHYIESVNEFCLVLVMKNIVDMDFLVELCDYKINSYSPIRSFKKVNKLDNEEIQTKIGSDFDGTKQFTVYVLPNFTIDLHNTYAIRYFETKSRNLFHQLLPNPLELGLSITLSHYIYDLLVLSKLFYDAEKLVFIQKSVYGVLKDMKQRNYNLDKALDKLERDLPKSERLLIFLNRLNDRYQNIEEKNELLKRRNQYRSEIRKKYDTERFLEIESESIKHAVKTYQCMIRNNNVYSRIYEKYCLVNSTY